MINNPNKFYDQNHPKAFTIGELIIGPMIKNIIHNYRNIILRIAIIGDSTTKYPTYLAINEPWKIIYFHHLHNKKDFKYLKNGKN